MDERSLQLNLIEVPDAGWRLDEKTRAVGRHGVALARQVLAGAAPPMAA